MMKNFFSSTIVTVAMILTMGACVTTGGSSKTEAQWAYNACVKSYNSKFRLLEGPKAMVSGQDNSSYNCFWNSAAASEEAAITGAMESCRREFTRCYVFATGSGISDWAQAINHNDGTDPAMARSRSSSGDVTNVLSGVLSGVSAGMQAGGGSSRSQPTYGGYTSSPSRSTGSRRNNCPGATIAVDENCKPLH